MSKVQEITPGSWCARSFGCVTDRIVVGEVQGAEVVDLLAALNDGISCPTAARRLLRQLAMSRTRSQNYRLARQPTASAR